MFEKICNWLLNSLILLQIPSLEQWNVIEEDYLASLSETTQALVNASLRLPLDVDIKVCILFARIDKEEHCSFFLLYILH